uniref:Uncharacterized protein n=1 Tax=Opuntia streptacantha TaxID=393608 RepID=A0A7C8YGA6_OPUST
MMPPLPHPLLRVLSPGRPQRSPPPVPGPSSSPTSIPGDWLPTPSSITRFHSLRAKPISLCEKLDVNFFVAEKFGFVDKLLRDNCLGLLVLRHVVYPRLVCLFYANLEVKSGTNGFCFETLVKSS